MADLTHLAGRVAQHGGQPRLRAGLLDVAALLLSEHIGDGDAGAVRRYIGELEHAQPPQAGPWRLLERLAVRLAATAPGPDDTEGEATAGGPQPSPSGERSGE